MTTLYPEKRREDATHRYEISSEDSYRLGLHQQYKVGILIFDL